MLFEKALATVAYVRKDNAIKGLDVAHVDVASTEDANASENYLSEIGKSAEA